MNPLLTKSAKLPAVHTAPFIAAMNGVREKIVGQNLGSLEIAQILTSALSRYHITFKPGWGESADPDQAKHFLVRASAYDNGDIEIEYENEFYSQFDDMADFEWNGFVQTVAKLIAHEMTHRNQLESIKNKHQNETGRDYVYKVDQAIRSMTTDPDKVYQYLGNPHEIAAFAREAVEELRSINYTDQQILQKLASSELKDLAGDSHTLWTYWDYFGAGDPVFKRFLQQMYRVVSTKEASKRAANPWAPWIGVDLDRTLATEPEPFEPLVIGTPIPEMVKKVQDAIAKGETVKVFTARLADPRIHDQLQEIIRTWTKKYIGVALDSTCVKDPGLKEMWDDRARQVEENTGEFKTAGPQGEGQRQHTNHQQENISKTDPEHPFAEEMEKEAKTGPHSNSTVQVNLPGSAAAKLLEAGLKIPDEELGTDGREDDPHITIKFGVRDDVEALTTTLRGVTPFNVTLGKLKVFSGGGGQAAIVAEAHAPELSQLHSLVDEAIGARPDDWAYSPHVTLAYTKPEFGEKYVGSDLAEGITFRVTAVVLSRKGGDRTTIPLTKTAHTFVKEPRSVGDVLVAVDPKKLDAVWKNDPGFYIGPGGEGQISDRYPRFQQWLKNNPGTPIEAPIVSWNPYNNTPSFTNGRHRFSVLRDMGAKKIYLAVPKDQVDIFKKFASHKTPPLSDTQYQKQDGRDGEGTQAWANIPERVQGEHEDLPLEELNPALFKQAMEGSLLYHGTRVDIAKKIVQEGMPFNAPKTRYWLGTNLEMAKHYGNIACRERGENQFAVVRVDGLKAGVTPAALKSLTTGSAVVVQSVPPEAILGYEVYNFDPEYAFKTAASYQNSAQLLDLGGGYWLSYAPHPKENGESNTWTILSDVDKLFAVGEVTLDFYPDLPAPSIRAIRLNDKHQQQGLGPKIVQALAKFYGGLTSDPQRNTNDYAKKMWRKIPGVQEVPSPKSTLNPPGNYFVLKAASSWGEIVTSGDLVKAGCRWLFHGTSSHFIENIKTEGLRPEEARLYVTVVPGIAWDEAGYTVRGEVKDEPGVGGNRRIVVIDATKVDVDWYSDPEYAREDASIPDAYWTMDSIPPSAIVEVLETSAGFTKYQNKYASAKSLKQEFLVEETEPNHFEVRLASSYLKSQLMPLRGRFAQVAQKVYDEWDQNEEGMDDMLGAGGICAEIANEIAEVIANNAIDCQVTEGGQEGDDHSWLLVYDESEAWGIDIPYSLYETGGGYNWKKKPGVTITPNDVEIFQVKDIDLAELGKNAAFNTEKLHSRENAKEIQQLLKGIDAKFVVAGSVSRKGISNHDLDFHVTPGPSFSYAQFHNALKAAEFDFMGNNWNVFRNKQPDAGYDMFQYRHSNGMKVDFFFKRNSVNEREFLDPVQVKTGTVKTAFKIEVPKSVRTHFWEEPPAGNWEFWAYRHRPSTLPGEKIVFTFDGAPIADAVVHHVEEPGKTKCENTGKYEKHFKVYWTPETFRRLDGK